MKKIIQFGGTVECINPHLGCFTLGRKYHVNQGYVGGEHCLLVKDDNDNSRSMTETQF